jgi:hypothetical protein
LYIRGTLRRGLGCEHFGSGPDEVDLNVIGALKKAADGKRRARATQRRPRPDSIRP